MISLDWNEQNSTRNPTTSSRRSVTTTTRPTTPNTGAKTISPTQYFGKILNHKIKNIQNQSKRVLFTKLTLMYSKQKKLVPRIIYQILFGNSLLLRPYRPPSIGPIFLTHGKSNLLKITKDSVNQLTRVTTQKNCSLYFRCFCNSSLQQPNSQNFKKINVQINICGKILNLSPNKPIKMDLNWFNFNTKQTEEILFTITQAFSEKWVVVIVCQSMVNISIDDLTQKIVTNKTLNKAKSIKLMQKNQFGFKPDQQQSASVIQKQTTNSTSIVRNIQNQQDQREIGSVDGKNKFQIGNVGSNEKNFNLKLGSGSNKNSENKEIPINFLSDTISLKCPLSRKRIKIPSRTINCKHLQCFDLTQFIKFAEFSKKWVCPCCNIKIKLNELIIDGFVQEIISMCNKQHEEVTVFPDGNWSLGKIEVNTQMPKPKQVDIVIDPEIEDFQDLYDILNPNNDQNQNDNFNDHLHQGNENGIENQSNGALNNNHNQKNNSNGNGGNIISSDNSSGNSGNIIRSNNSNNVNHNYQLETNSSNFSQVSSLQTNFDIPVSNQPNSNGIIRKRQFSQTSPNITPTPLTNKTKQTERVEQTEQTEQRRQDQFINNNQNYFNLTTGNFDFGFFQNNNENNNNNNMNTATTNNTNTNTNTNINTNTNNNTNTLTNTNNNNNINTDSNKIRRTLTTHTNGFFGNLDDQFSQQTSLNFPDQTSSEMNNFNFNTNLNSLFSQFKEPPNKNQDSSYNQLFFDSMDNFD
ncbi:e3 sumo-protein ligase pias1 [Anaeramoeba flamelloides]|uniref:E3 sumo-protein ligase pias1 n=1 Tax=Anaeramoeba flamelloides TaxID=1746091 RepID=A0AAV7ZN32_9EUKA|nr:e3 sumo-protein ligase pias1 [Anaeramoeba flamelloides]